jgi:large subunit ribosomal protein L22
METMSVKTREFRAEARFQRVSPQKARLVLDLIKGQRVEQALTIIAFTKKGVAPLIEKVLRSALQNANYLSGEQGLDIDVDNLYVKTAIANEGPRMKRIRPAPMGRAFRYQRRLAHISVSIAELDGDFEETGHAHEQSAAKPTKQSTAKRLAKAASVVKKAANRKNVAGRSSGTAKSGAGKQSPAQAVRRKPSATKA